MIAFISNSSWYLRNFRSPTLLSFLEVDDVVCMTPAEREDLMLGDLGCRTKSIYLDATGTNPFKEVVSLFSILFSLAVQRPEVVYSFNPKTNLYSLICCWLLRIPCVPNVSGVGVASQLNGIAGRVYKVLVSFFYRRASYVFFQNKDDYQAFLEVGWVVSDRAEILPGSGVDLERFNVCDNADKGSFRFLMAARLIGQKGVVEYLEAAREVLAEGEKCEFVLAGIVDTSSRAIDKKILSDLEDEPNIRFVGHVEDMPELLKSIDCVVLPSYYPEGVPRSLIEAAAASKMIITTDMPGCREVVVEGENGFLVEPRSISQLAAAMTRIIKLPEERKKAMSEASRSLAEARFDENIVIQRYLTIAKKLKIFPMGISNPS